MKHTPFSRFSPKQFDAVARTLLATLLLVGLLPEVKAQSEEVYLCINAQGQREYKNTGNVKGCKRVELMGLTTVPAPKPPAATAPAARAATAAAATPPEFPKVDPAIQKARDNDRKKILQDELQSEEAKLANLRQEYKGGEPERRGDERNAAKYFERVAKMAQDISSAEKNIEALKREISNLR
jgi:hypothetical protein